MYQIICRQGLEDFTDAKNLRTEVFMREQGFQQEFDEIDSIALHLVVYNAGIPIATGRAYHLPEDTEGLYHIGRICVCKDYRGKRIGALVVGELERISKEHAAKQVTLSAQMQAAGFYRSLGYQETGDVYQDEGCPHIQMTKILS